MSYETVVGVIAGIHPAGFVKVAHEDDSQKVVHGKRIIGMLLDDLFHLLHGPIVFHVVKVLEGEVSLLIFQGTMRGHDLGIFLTEREQTASEKKR